MYTLPHQVEFLDNAWLAEVERFLTREVVTRRDRLSRFSVTEIFTDAPSAPQAAGQRGSLDRAVRRRRTHR